MNKKPSIIFIGLDLTSLLSNYLLTEDTQYASSFFDAAYKTSSFRIGHINPSFDIGLLLYENENGTSIIDYLLENEFELNSIFEKYIQSDYRIIKKYIEFGFYEYDEKALLKQSGETTLLERLIDDNVEIDVSEFSDPKTIEILLNKKRYDLLINCSSSSLVKEMSDGITYIDYILDEFLKSRDFDITKNIEYDLSNQDKALMYFAYAKRDLINYLSEPSIEDLFTKDEDGTILIDILIEKDLDLSINTILRDSIKSSPVIVYLKLKNIDVDLNNISVNISDNAYVYDFLEEHNSELGEIILQEEDEEVLSRFEELMEADDESDDDLVYLLIDKVRSMVNKGNRNALKIIEMLSKVKEENPNFIMILSDVNDFNKNLNLLQMKEPNAELLFHEIGHALHYYLTNYEVPDNFYEVLNETRMNPSLLANINDYTTKFNIYEKQISNYLEQKYLSNYSETIDEEEIKDTIDSEKASDVELLSEFGFEEEEIERVFDSVVDENKYKEEDKKSKIRALTDIYFFTDCLSFATVGAMLDCITGGTVLKSGYVHSEACFIKNKDNIFLELFADFMILKSIDENEVMTKYFRRLVGDKIVDLLEDFYQNRIINTEMNLTNKLNK